MIYFNRVSKFDSNLLKPNKDIHMYICFLTGKISYLSRVNITLLVTVESCALTLVKCFWDILGRVRSTLFLFICRLLPRLNDVSIIWAYSATLRYCVIIINVWFSRLKTWSMFNLFLIKHCHYRLIWLGVS